MFKGDKNIHNRKEVDDHTVNSLITKEIIYNTKYPFLKLLLGLQI